ncbi:hypothetical protein ATANTOWER_015319 [Ataeniobius toweri]|uniref:Uncharacterized protein n=1 Tax=Ataeniobius toweri TaxID=208326 RepID=A0ABU7BQN9_9TELE|nr:hypothetical protein [Ataeniobius toweri]
MVTYANAEGGLVSGARCGSLAPTLAPVLFCRGLEVWEWPGGLSQGIMGGPEGCYPLRCGIVCLGALARSHNGGLLTGGLWLLWLLGMCQSSLDLQGLCWALGD